MRFEGKPPTYWNVVKAIQWSGNLLGPSRNDQVNADFKQDKVCLRHILFSKSAFPFSSDDAKGLPYLLTRRVPFQFVVFEWANPISVVAFFAANFHRATLIWSIILSDALRLVSGCLPFSLHRDAGNLLLTRLNHIDWLLPEGTNFRKENRRIINRCRLVDEKWNQSTLVVSDFLLCLRWKKDVAKGKSHQSAFLIPGGRYRELGKITQDCSEKQYVDLVGTVITNFYRCFATRNGFFLASSLREASGWNGKNLLRHQLQERRAAMFTLCFHFSRKQVERDRIYGIKTNERFECSYSRKWEEN